ncbi:toxin-antitoxin system YwqK family antitoxin [Psychroflexus planctonicus]|uniref:Antitoxin component YwqK of the YwqJK toxin-antitoxin module n=1 Tax=Psychroflexus planctonicus TaxID=1526575 RepID=A0ABQ1SCI7_9FLAO|nr:toxin-antitoxin system YwqK family antitoxin [Psychroflexus planctonicus]GGE28070.1 hypothetical protein GCM10010832_05990 [Psychroflexus planctonicus]
MKYTLLSLFLFSILTVFSQKKEVIYEVDGIRVDPVFYEELNDLNDEIVDRFKVIEDEIKINALGYSNAERLIQIETKAYVSRPDSLKRIPSTREMDRILGKWHLKDNPQVYTGPFRDYYLNGNLQGKGNLQKGKLEGKRWLYFKDGSISEELHYKNGFPDGKEIRYYPNGKIKQVGYYNKGFEVGEWKKFHINGELKQVSSFNENGKLDGEVLTYYSTGELKGESKFKDGKLINDRKTRKLNEAYDTAKRSFELGNFKEAEELFTKCIKLKSDWNDAYFGRGTAYLNDNEFEKALSDFNKAIEIEPLDAYAYTNRAFVLIRQQEFKAAKKQSSTEGMQVFGTKNVEIPDEDIQKICQDLQKAKDLGDDSRMLLNAISKYCY